MESYSLTDIRTLSFLLHCALVHCSIATLMLSVHPSVSLYRRGTVVI